MLNNLFQVMFFNQYLIYPTTWIHKIHNGIKIHTFFICLYLVIYISHEYIIILLLIYLVAQLTLKIPKHLLFNLKQVLLVSFICFLNCYISNVHIRINIKYQLSQLVQDNYEITSITQNNNTYPLYIFRGAIIYLVYLASLKLLYLTTTYESVMIYIFFCNNWNSQKNLVTMIFTIIIGLHLIILLTKRIQETIHVLVLRDSYSQHLYSYALQFLLRNLSFDIQRLSLMLYCREISIQFLNFCYLSEIYSQ